MSKELPPKNEIKLEESDTPDTMPTTTEIDSNKQTKEVYVNQAEQAELKKTREQIKKIYTNPDQTEEADDTSREKKIMEYQEKYLPDYLRGKKTFFAKALTKFWIRMSGECQKEGIENIPTRGPYIVIGNHFGGGDAEAILETFNNDNLHFVIAKEIWWNTPLKWLFKKFGMIPVKESLNNLSDQEKEAALKRQGKSGQKVFRKIIDREKEKITIDIDFVRQAVAALMRGDALAIYPEGLWLNPEGIGKMAREKKEMKKGTVP